MNVINRTIEVSINNRFETCSYISIHESNCFAFLSSLKVVPKFVDRLFRFQFIFITSNRRKESLEKNLLRFSYAIMINNSICFEGNLERKKEEPKILFRSQIETTLQTVYFTNFYLTITKYVI